MKLMLKILALILIVPSCSTVPVTGRKQLALIPNSELFPLSYTTYQDVLKENKLSSNAQQTALVKNVGLKIQKAVEAYMAENNMSKQLSGYAWEFNLLEGNTVNAWCMPGGKVAFYEGIMPVCKDEAGVAVVMGHEIAHAIGNHGRERMSQGLVQQFGGVALAVAIRDKPEETQQLFFAAYGIGTTLGAMLPYSRLHESEADRLGMIFMAMAGYNPNEAPKFWERMAEVTGGAQPPEWLSTHPSHDRRIRDLEEYIPTAMQYYRP
jgi:predicted Zn-dependent protease